MLSPKIRPSVVLATTLSTVFPFRFENMSSNSFAVFVCGFNVIVAVSIASPFLHTLCVNQMVNFPPLMLLVF